MLWFLLIIVFFALWGNGYSYLWSLKGYIRAKYLHKGGSYEINFSKYGYYSLILIIICIITILVMIRIVRNIKTIKEETRQRIYNPKEAIASIGFIFVEPCPVLIYEIKRGRGWEKKWIDMENCIIYRSGRKRKYLIKKTKKTSPSLWAKLLVFVTEKEVTNYTVYL